jgi:hypothetical protein
MAKVNKFGVIVPEGRISKAQAATYRSRGGVARTLRATRSDAGKKRK